MAIQTRSEPDFDDIAAFAREHHLAMVVLFGSRGRRPDSDWDLALLPSVDSGPIELIEEQLVHRLQRGDLDFLWLHYANPLSASQVARDGSVVYQDGPFRFQRFCQQAALRRADELIWSQRDRDFIERSLEGRWTVDKDLIGRKLALLARYLEELAQVMEVDQDTFTADFRVHRVAERQIELLIECAASINTEVAQAVARIPPYDYYSSFFSLASTGWVEPETARRLATLVGLRNRLVHQYDEVRLGPLYLAAQRSLPDWKAYLRGISEHLAA
jgi:uncharacterized protein YutE (UPF0331/DUF86 family)